MEKIGILALIAGIVAVVVLVVTYVQMLVANYLISYFSVPIRPLDFLASFCILLLSIVLFGRYNSSSKS
jgi:hypothetical protein